MVLHFHYQIQYPNWNLVHKTFMSDNIDSLKLVVEVGWQAKGEVVVTVEDEVVEPGNELYSAL